MNVNKYIIYIFILLYFYWTINYEGAKYFNIEYTFWGQHERVFKICF